MADTPDSLIASSRDPGRETAPGAPLLEAVLDVIGCLVVVLDRDGRIVQINRAFELVTGYALDDVRGRRIWERLLPAETVAPVRRVFDHLVDTGGPSEHDNPLLCRDGSTVHVRWRDTTLRDADGTVHYVIGTGVDLSERRRLEGALDERDARLHAILDTAVDAIVTIDDHGAIESVNAAAERMFGHARADMIGRNVSMLMPEPYHARHDRYVAHYRETGDPRIIGIGREVEALRADGSTFPVGLAVSEVPIEGRRLFTGIVRDISDRRHAEAQARIRLQDAAHAGRLLELGEMLSGIAHEVNQPLTAIVSFAEACRRMHRAGTGSPEVMSDALAQIADQGQRAARIIQRLRRLGRKEDARREPFDVNDSVREVLELVDHEVRRHGVTVRTELDPELPPAVGDPVLVEQVLLNLLRNAIDAVRGPGAGGRELRVTSAPGGDGALRVTVDDTGVGLPEGDAERCFETFFTTKPGGVGIGLAISRSIVAAHGGRLWAAPREGGGTRFACELPAGDQARR